MATVTQPSSPARTCVVAVSRNFRSPHNFSTCWPAQFASGHQREKMPSDRGEDYCENTPFISQGGDRRGNPEGARPGGPKRGASRGGPQP
ncbi:hypothetical protein TNIN_498061 [Trichonephila inaurata madagascariensis]|uniref:Uncharacterized protein n=1 Tax=Trichonephila inaurata madagascariensis TaxID=2747483 RepID=A0A8X7BW04_9ARAC|nr:hypothetical protein TNIN_498061 [Trichonephila inaurata madagascariensis]